MEAKLIKTKFEDELEQKNWKITWTQHEHG